MSIITRYWPKHEEWMSGYVDYKFIRIGPITLSLHPPEQYEHPQWILSIDWGRVQLVLHAPQLTW